MICINENIKCPECDNNEIDWDMIHISTNPGDGYGTGYPIARCIKCGHSDEKECKSFLIEDYSEAD